MRDRRWDHLYERQRQPVKEWVLERLAEELARELDAWPPPFVDWVAEDQRARWAAGAAGKPRPEVLRLALEMARLDLAREFEAEERLLAREKPVPLPPRRWKTPAGRASPVPLTVSFAGFAAAPTPGSPRATDPRGRSS